MQTACCGVNVYLGLGLLVAQLAIHLAAENETDAEFRQGGIGQQLISNYPVVGGGLGGFQYMNAGPGNAGQGYVNMLRNLYRPPSFGLTDKVKHWVKSFMNRRQYVKPYYNPSVGGLQYSADEFGGKPVILGGNTYKAFSVPLRQLQKYYKPYYPSGENGQFMQSAGRPGSGSAPSSSILSYSPNSGGAPSSGVYASESGNVFSGASSGLFGTGSDSFSGNLYSQGDGSSPPLFGSGLNGGSGFSLDSSSAGLYGSDGSSAFYAPNSGGSSLSGGQVYGDLFASPSATVYNDQARGYGSHKASFGASSSALYMPSDQRNSDAPKSSPQEQLNSFNVDSSRNSAEPSYSVSFQPKSSLDNAGFQPVAFSSHDSAYKNS